MSRRLDPALMARLDEALHEWWDDEHDGVSRHGCRPVPSEDEFVAALARVGLTVARIDERAELRKRIAAMVPPPEVVWAFNGEDGFGLRQMPDWRNAVLAVIGDDS